jgi:hypothetical protein
MTDDRELIIVVHLPQEFSKVVALLKAVSDQWPDIPVEGNLIEVPADDR